MDQVSDVARRVAEIPYLPLETMEQRAEQQKALSNLHHAANTVSNSLDSLMNRLVAGSIQVQLELAEVVSCQLSYSILSETYALPKMSTHKD